MPQRSYSLTDVQPIYGDATPQRERQAYAIRHAARIVLAFAAGPAIGVALSLLALNLARCAGV